MAAIPAKKFVSVNDAIISAGGGNLDTIGLEFTNNPRCPYGAILSFANAAAVGAYFGLSSLEYTLAGYYFAGFDNSNQKPGAMLFAQYATAAVSAYLRGASGLTLANVQALTGVLTIAVNGNSAITSSTINLGSVMSFSAAAAAIQAAFTSPGFTVSYDSIAGAFVLTSNTTGTASSIGFPTGSLAAPLLLTSATGAIVSPGGAADTPPIAMNRITAKSQDFISFATTFDPDNGSGHVNKMLFAQWVSQNGGYSYVAWHTDITETQTGNTTSLGPLLTAAKYNGTESIYAPVNGAIMGAVKLGFTASVDHNEANGRTNYAFRAQAGLTPDVTDQTISNNLDVNGSNYYCAVSTRNKGFSFYYNGQISGNFDWADDYLDQIWLDDQFQVSALTALTTYKSVPFNAGGRTQVKASLQAPADNAVAYGMIQTGVNLSAQQIQEVKTAAGGIDISGALYATGYYILIPVASSALRATRGPIQPQFFYTSGESVNTINLTNTLVQ